MAFDRAANRAEHLRLLEELNDKLARAARGGSDKARERHVARGKLLPRDRVETLLDPGSPFIELAPLAADGMYDDECPGAGVIGVAVGFGSQTLVRDVITGIFLLFEDAVAVGDVVQLGGLSGVVEHLSIRAIKLRAQDGSVHIIRSAPSPPSPT